MVSNQQGLTSCWLGAKSEVNQLQLVVLVYQNVLGFEVPVSVPSLVDVGDPRHDLSEELPTLGLAESVPVHNVVEQLSAGTVLQDLNQRPVRRRLGTLLSLSPYKSWCLSPTLVTVYRCSDGTKLSLLLSPDGSEANLLRAVFYP